MLEFLDLTMIYLFTFSFFFQVDKLKENHDWFLNTLNKFKPPSESSKMALNSAQVNVGLHNLIIKPQFKELALKLSSVAVMFFLNS